MALFVYTELLILPLLYVCAVTAPAGFPDHPHRGFGHCPCN